MMANNFYEINGRQKPSGFRDHLGITIRQLNSKFRVQATMKVLFSSREEGRLSWFSYFCLPGAGSAASAAV
ncbi:hypothetical protein Desku_2234 [Desulfofundulus kuznetsovii DSM 6115]|uniref:Uncharacterized protein n=1 Tax=Desulfofundulus kuznetsovii (strain DSM 6115 / VKM B-1805 / 17) TaxID=760568 RepID=A0AAU8PE76_DESK7|nr:hypothetical protein Desku_2234 [Desulfofundulus kuznetsovii DSM 6115]